MEHSVMAWIRTGVVAAAGLVWLLAPSDVRAEGNRSTAWHLVRAPSPGPSQAIGGYTHGCLAGGVALPLDGIGFQVVRPGRHRYFGHPVLIEYLESLGRRTHAAGLPLFNIGDMAQPRGGPMNSGHASHQVGLDVDIWLRLDLPLLPRNHRDDLKEVTMVDSSAMSVTKPPWSQAQADLIRLAARDPKVVRIFVNPAIKIELCRRTTGDRDWLHLIRPWYGHDDHIHVRLACPPDSPLCEAQKPVPPGEGCDAELASWLVEAKPQIPKPPAPPPPNPVLPQACSSVNVATAPLGGFGQMSAAIPSETTY